MKKKFLFFCYYWNIGLLIFYLVFILSILFKQDSIKVFFTNDTLLIIRQFLNIPILILWIFNISFWSKNDKNVKRFFLIFFLNAIYNPFYFKRISHQIND